MANILSDPSTRPKTVLLSTLSRICPFLLWWPVIDRRTMRADAVAGLAGAVVVLPQGVAFATLAGLPPEYGLYAAMASTIIAALFGSSGLLVSGPSATASLVVFSSLHSLADPGSAQYVSYAITLTFMVGVFQLAMGFARLGVLAEFVSHAVVVGFTAGSAIIIAASQIHDLLGLPSARSLQVYDMLLAATHQFGDVRWPAVVVGAATVGCGVASRRWMPRLPYLLIAMLAGIAVFLALRILPGEVSETMTVGALPARLPPLSAPDMSYETVRTLAPTALAVGLFALTQAVSIGRTVADRTGQPFNGSQEFIGQGLSNLLGSFFSTFVGTGSFTRSALNYEAGAKTPLAAVFAGVMLIGIVLLIAPSAAYLPKAALSGVLLMVALNLLDLRQIRRILAASRADAVALVVTFAATLMLELDFAILVGVLSSLVMYLRRTSRPMVLLRVPDPRSPKRRFTTDAMLPECPQLRIVRIDGSLFFGAVSYVAKRLALSQTRMPEQHHLLILARSINFVDVAGAELLARIAAERREEGGALYLSHVKKGVREVLSKGDYLQAIGAENLFESKPQAIATIFDRLDREICRRCDKRIFNECAGVPRAADEPDPSDQAVGQEPKSFHGAGESVGELNGTRAPSVGGPGNNKDRLS